MRILKSYVRTRHTNLENLWHSESMYINFFIYSRVNCNTCSVNKPCQLKSKCSRHNILNDVVVDKYFIKGSPCSNSSGTHLLKSRSDRVISGLQTLIRIGSYPYWPGPRQIQDRVISHYPEGGGELTGQIRGFFA